MRPYLARNKKRQNIQEASCLPIHTKGPLFQSLVQLNVLSSTCVFAFTNCKARKNGYGSGRQRGIFTLGTGSSITLSLTCTYMYMYRLCDFVTHTHLGGVEECLERCPVNTASLAACMERSITCTMRTLEIS